VPNERYNSANFLLDTWSDLTLLVALRSFNRFSFCFIFTWLLAIVRNRTADR
jgi:hypothetical protein